MNRPTSSYRHADTRESPPRGQAPRRDRGERRSPPLPLGELWRGSVFFGAALLLGGCSIMGAAPLGLGLLAAGSVYTWYVLGGLLLGAALLPTGLGGWALAGVYILCVALRLVIRFFVDPPAFPDGRPCGGRTYLLLCWVSFKRNLGLVPDSAPEVDADDYYAGRGKEPPPPPRRSPLSDKLPRGGLWNGDSGRFEPRLFSEHPLLRMMTAAVCGFAAGIFGMLRGGFHWYDLLSTLLGVVLTPAATFLFVSCFGEAGLTLLFSPAPAGQPRDGLNGGDRVRRPLREAYPLLSLISVAFLVTAVVFSARHLVLPLGTPYLTVEVGLLLALLLTLFACERLGAVAGVGVSVLCGLAADLRGAPVCILCAGGYLLLRYLSHRAGVLGGCTAGAVWSVAVDGMVVTVTRLPAILLTVPVFLVVERLCMRHPTTDRASPVDGELKDFTDMVAASLLAERNAQAQCSRLRALSEAFDTLSKRFYRLSGQFKQPRLNELRRLCDEVFGRVCARCPQRDRCWGEAYDRTLALQEGLARRLHEGVAVSPAALPAGMGDFCPRLEPLTEELNTRYARMTGERLRAEKTEAYAADYEAIAALLGDVLDSDSLSEEEYRHNRLAADRIYEHLSRRGVRVQGVAVCGRREGRRQVIVRGRDFEGVRGDLPALRREMEDICGGRLSLPRFEAEGDSPSTVMTLSSAPLLEATYAAGTSPADRKGGPCGDHLALFKTEEACFYALISDGMGSGEEAALTSDICVMFLERMLGAGGRVDISLRMLNSYLRAKNSGTGEECSATVDLMELDLMDGEAVFSKNGAPPTYVVREGTVYLLRSPSMPIGILREAPPRLLRFRMRPGDVVVMVSDGVTLGNDECPWLLELLSAPLPESMDTLRADILRRAISAGSPDDLSAIAIRLEGAEP